MDYKKVQPEKVKGKNIVVVGSLNMDVSIVTPKIPEMGETILGEGLQISPGGKGANQAVAIAKLGGSVTMVGCVGKDIFGENLITNLKESRVNIDYIKQVEDIPTGVALIMVKRGNNCIIVDPGANNELKPACISKLHEIINESSLVVIQLEIPQETVENVINIANKLNVPILLDPAPARELSDEFLSKIDIFTPNEIECRAITGIHIKEISDAKRALAYLLSKGIGQVVITLGSRGVVYNSGNRIIHKPVIDVEVVDTTAAGDAFTGALAVAIIEGKDIDEAIHFANTVGALTVTKKGAQSSLPVRGDVRGMSGGCQGDVRGTVLLTLSTLKIE